MSTLPVARLLGFEIRIHVSWAIILAIIAVTVVSELARVAPETSAVVRWVVGGFIALAFLGSALAHELGHAVAARRAGVPGGPVVVYFFGSAASPSLVGRDARAETRIALAGPLVSLVLGGGLLILAALGELVGAGVVQAIGRLALVVGVLNLLLGLMNLLPAYPLDGGRALRGILWMRGGDPRRALLAVARVGRWLGLTLAGLGLLAIIVIDSADGLMLAMGGWFLVISAKAAERAAEADALLEGLFVSDVMEHDVPGIPPGLTVDTFAGQLLATGASASIPVVRGLELLGIIGARQVRRLRRTRWAETRAADLMVRADALPPVGPAMTLRAVLDELHRSGLDGLPVMDQGAFAGIVTREAVAAAIRSRVLAAAAR